MANAVNPLLSRMPIVSTILSARHDPAARTFNVDLLATMTAAVLPWSTTGVLVLMTLWTLALIFTIEWSAFLRSLLRPAAILPIALVTIGAAGMFWADCPWDERLRGLSQVAKLLAIPALLYHFERSQRASWVLRAFLASCTVLMIASWLVFFIPDWKPRVTYNPGIPVKNYIDQSQEFALCVLCLAPLTLVALRQRQWRTLAVCMILIAGFVANMVFVVSARTALFSMAVLAALFAVLYLRRHWSLLLLAGIIAVGSVAWSSSSYLRHRITSISAELNDHQHNLASSAGRRLEYWNKSLGFIAAAPVIGSGTGSSRSLFERAAGQSGLAAEVPSNPHNQTLAVAVQWGMLGVVVLYGMWFCHFRLFRGTNLPAWIGLIVVIQNFMSSVLHSHLFDFNQGWIYVLGVGTAGGVMRQATGTDEPTAISSQG